MSRYIIYSVISVFIIVILFQLNSYLTIINIPSNNNSLIPEQQHQQEYYALIFYLFILSFVSLFILLQSWINSRKRLIPHISIWHRWFLYEYYPFQLFRFNLYQLFQITCLAGLNLFLFYQLPFTTFTTSKLSQQQQYYHVLSNRAAQLAVTNVAFAVALSAKLSIVQSYFIDVRETVRWHTWFARLGFLQALYHACFQLGTNYEKQDHDLFMTLTSNVRHVSGACMVLALSCLFWGSHHLIRRLSYFLFRATHFLGFFGMILMGCLHHWSFYVFYGTVLVFWVMDQLDQGYCVHATLEGLPGDVVRVECQAPYPVTSIMPGQFVLLRQSYIQSHPFTICRVEQRDHLYLTLYIKASGHMTRALVRTARDHTVVLKNQLRISKPIGRPLDMSVFESVVLVAEGIGITPWISVLHDLIQRQHTVKTKSIDIVWSLHSIDMFYAFEKEFSSMIEANEVFEIHGHVYVTGPSDPEETYSIPNNLTFIHFTTSCRPHYPMIMKEINERTHTSHVVGICAHDTTLVQLNHVALYHGWCIRTEQFEL